MYKIFRYFSPAARQAVCDTPWRRQNLYSCLRDPDSRCPLGVANEIDRPGSGLYAPGPDLLAETLVVYDDYSEALGPSFSHYREQIRAAANRLMRAWDSGRIGPADLPRVTGLRSRV